MMRSVATIIPPTTIPTSVAFAPCKLNAYTEITGRTIKSPKNRKDIIKLKGKTDLIIHNPKYIII